MSNKGETWIDEAEELALFLNQDKGGDAARLFEMSPTNRTIAGRKQAILLASMRFAADYYTSIYPDTGKYSWMNKLCDIVEGYQLTLDGEQNSRRQFIKVAIANVSNFLKGQKGDKAEDITAGK